jgi:galactofuranosylgalactofuranosylrhamnosyl-N-acetylglucosaminyl-diphospho-decaprenol beta-1,5/1,6-galactofuranosyltransferase
MAGQPERIVAQRLLFAAPVPEAPDDLYVRILEGKVARERDAITVYPHSSVTSNSYFGRFPASYWQRWTEVPGIRWQGRVSGSGELRLMASDSLGKERVVHAITAKDDQAREVEVDLPLDRFVDGGAYWLDLRTAKTELTVEHSRWTVVAPEHERPTAVAMPTFNRVSYAIATLTSLTRDQEALDLLAAVYLVDQGSDPVEANPGFPGVVEALAGKLTYIRQPNLGGSGGYSRGLREASENHGEHVNVLFLDDDIWLEPDVIFRLSAFEQHTRKPVIVGGQMLRLLHPDRLHVGAETADLSTLAAGEVVTKSLADADVVDDEEMKEAEPPKNAKERLLKRTQFQQEARVEAGYNGWWACLIPSEVVRNVGYPLPAFFQWDDIEYGYRARELGYPTVTLPGAGVWHLDFDWKDWDDWHRYFNLRNSMITSALHSDFDQSRIAIGLLHQLVRYLVSMQYGLAATLIKAVDDFLAGPEFLHDGGMQAAADIRKLRAEYPETVRHPAADVPGVDFGDAPLISSGTPPMVRRPLVFLRLLKQLGGKIEGTASIPAGSAFWWHVSRFATTVVTDASQEGVRVRHLDKDNLRRLGMQGVASLTKLYRQGPAVAAEYRKALPELTSRENWQRLYSSM